MNFEVSYDFLTILSMAGKDILKRQLHFFSEIIFYFINGTPDVITNRSMCAYS